MDAKLRNVAVCLTACLLCQVALAATHQTTNFIVTAPSAEIAEKVARCAEVWREDLAIQWLGETLPNWFKPCPIQVKVGQIGAGGSTTFTFENGEVFGWSMKVQGTLERILDSVIPHEVNHTIFASHFRRPLPRWADEGAATLFEHKSEQNRQLDTLNRVVQTNRRIPLQQLLTIREYPAEMEDVLTLYAEGFSLATFLVGQKGELGRKVYLQFLEDAHRSDWNQAICKHYGFESIQTLERDWTTWVLAGSPTSTSPTGSTLLAANIAADSSGNGHSSESGNVIRFQSPDPLEPLSMIPRPLRDAQGQTRNELIAVGRNTSHRQHDAVHSSESSQDSARSQDHQAAQDQPEVEGHPVGNRPQQSTTPSRPLPRESLVPTADGLSSNPNAKAYQFPQMRPF